MENHPTIVSKQPHHSGYEGFDLILSNGRKVSVLNFSDAMKNHPYPAGLYSGWEAFDGNETYRGDSYEEVEKLLLSL